MHSVLNEGGVADLFSLIMGGARSARKNNNEKGRVYLKGSISKYVNNLIMSFPMLCDSTLPINTLTMIATANEYNVVDLLQMLFSSVSIKGDNGIEILRSYYKGIDNNMGMEDMIEFLDNLVLGEETNITDPELRDAIHEMCMELKNPKYFPKDSISERSLCDYLVYGNDERISVREDNKLLSDIEVERETEKHNWQRDRNTRENERHKGKDFAGLKANQDIINRTNQNRLTNQEVKKQNELKPTLMVINFVDVLGGGRGQIVKSFTAGVKSRVIPVESMDIVERLAEKNPQRNGSGLSKFVKFTTGEISLAKSISDSFTRTKLKAKNAVKNKSGIGRMWDILEKRGIANNASKVRRVSNDASAITGLVVSQETVNYLKNSYDFDIERVKNAKKVMDAYNLMSIFIADEANEIVKSIYDGNQQYEYLSYTSLHKDVADKNYKKIINLLNSQR